MTVPTVVPTVILGDNLEVSALGFGGMALSGVYGDSDPADDLATLHHAVDVGVTFVDTAEIYGAGTNEELLARLLADRRDEVKLATNFGVVGSIADKTLAARGSAAYVRYAAEASLARLGIETIDLYYLHRRQVEVPIEKTVGAMADLVHAGEVSHLGLSEVTAAELEAAHAVHPIAAVKANVDLEPRRRTHRRPHRRPAWHRIRALLPTRARLPHRHPHRPRRLRRGLARRPEPLHRPRLQSQPDRCRRPCRGHPGARSHPCPGCDRVALHPRPRPRPAGRAHPGTRRAARIDENTQALTLQLTAEQLQRLDWLAATVVGRRSDHDDPAWTSDTRESTTCGGVVGH